METADTTTDPAAQTEIREIVRSLYSLYAPVMVHPDRIVDIAVLLEPWSGREQELLERAHQIQDTDARVQAECNLFQWTLESDVWQPLSSPDADLELSTQVKYVAALIRVLHDRLDQKLGHTSHQATPRPPDVWPKEKSAQDEVNLENLDKERRKAVAAQKAKEASLKAKQERAAQQAKREEDLWARQDRQWSEAAAAEISEAMDASAELERRRLESQQLEEAQLMQALAESAQEQVQEARAAQEQLTEARAAQEQLEAARLGQLNEAQEQLAAARKAQALAESKAAEAERALASERKRRVEKQEKATADADRLADEKSRIELIMAQHEAERQAVAATEAAEQERQKLHLHQRLQATLARASLIKQRQQTRATESLLVPPELLPPDYKAKSATLLLMRKEREEGKAHAHKPEWLEPRSEQEPEPG